MFLSDLTYAYRALEKVIAVLTEISVPMPNRSSNIHNPYLTQCLMQLAYTRDEDHRCLGAQITCPLSGDSTALGRGHRLASERCVRAS